MTFYKVSMVNLVTFLLTALCFFCQTSHGEDYSSCGLRSVHRGKIFGGLLSRPGMWPWQVAIFRKIRNERQRPRFRCGGALLNSRWVLSAAHCFHKRPYEEYIDYSYTVKAGEYKIDIKDPHEQERNAFRIHNHPNFVPRTYENDIALIELDKGVKIGPHVRSICLPKANEILTTSGEVVSVAGWGFTTKGSYSSVLLYSAFEIQTNKKCADTTRYLYNETVMFCAGQSKGGNDTCKGDSGGSTVRQVLQDGRRRWVTVGLVSWGEECGIKGKYGYYTRMEPFVPWIQDKINGSSLSCGNPGSIRNGQIIGSEFLVGFTVKYICNEGYRMRGRSTGRCRRNGKWTKAPTCLKVECINPGTPRYGVRRPRRNKYYYKDKIRFRCKRNYTIVGRSAMRCRSDGTWSGFKPVCLAPCKDPGIPTGGIRLDHSFKHSQTVRFLCRKRNQPPSVSFLICNNGKWNQNIPRCIADCDDPGTPINGQRQGDDFTLNKRVYFTCDRGYMRVGPAYLQCQSNRRWSDNAPICQHLSCIRPKLPENAYIYGRGQLKEKYGFDEVVMFQCKKGYSTSGSPFVRCLADGWSKTNLRCPPKNCGDPGHPANGRRQGYVFTFKSQVNFTCDGTGYELKGSSQRVCQENGRWSGTRTTCEPVECRDPGRLVNGGKYPEQNKYVFKDSIRFQCKTNYTIRGDSSITCQHNKRWSGNIPTCLAPCRDPGIPNNGRRLDHSFLHNDRVRFSCQRGWNINGAQSIICDNGNWDHPTPQCLECGSPLGMAIDGRIPDGNIQASSTRWRYHARDGRLNGPYAWCSGTERSPYLQVDFDKPYRITGLATQGSAHDNRWVERYSVSSNLAGSSFNTYREDNRDKIFDGNRDKGSTVKNKLRRPLIARRLRIHPQKEGGFSRLSPACMRVEIYGCDLPSDCIAVGSRIVAKWVRHHKGYYIYLKAYLTEIGFFWKVELEKENHGSPVQQYVAKYTDLPFVLDVPPKHEELQVGTRVLAPWWSKWYTCTIKAGRNGYNKYLVMADDGHQKELTIDQMRLLKAPVFC